MGSEETNVPNKPSRRRAYSHEVHSVINLSDYAGRDKIAYDMQLHRSSTTTTTPCVTEKEHPTMKGNNNSNYDIDVSMSSDAKYCYYLLEAMPLPGPIWSTTGPSVLAEPQYSAPFEASLGLEWGENQASSYTWWLGFLEGLDGNMNSEKLELPFVENIVMENSKGHSHESNFVDAIDLSFCPDDWLMNPTMEKDLGDIVMP